MDCDVTPPARRAKTAAQKEEPQILSNLYYLLAWAVLCLLTMHYVQSNFGGMGLSLPFNSTSWIAVSIVIAVGMRHVAATSSLNFSNQDFQIGLTLAALALPLLWSASPWRESSYDRYLGLFAMWMIVLGRRQFSLDSKHVEILLSLVVSAGLIQCAVCILQFAAPDHISWFEGNRPRGTFQQTNLVATFIGTAMAIAFYLSAGDRRTKYSNFLASTMLVCGACALVLIVSRTGLLGTALSILGLTILLGFRRTHRGWVYIAIGLAFAAILVSTKPDSFGRSDPLDEVGYRNSLYGISLELIRARPLTGWGLGRFQSVYMERLADHNAQGSSYDYWNRGMNHPHNELLFWGVEGGLIPIVAIALLGLSISWRTWRNGKKHNKAMWCCALPIVLHTQTELPLYLSVPHLALLALLLAEMEPSVSHRLNIKSGLLLRISGPLLVIAVTVFMITNLQAISVLMKLPENPNSFAKIINPIGQQKRVNELMSQILSGSDNPAARQDAEEMAQIEAQLRPSTGSFRILANVLYANGKVLESERIVARGRYLFPTSPKFLDSYVLPPARPRNKTMNQEE